MFVAADRLLDTSLQGSSEVRNIQPLLELTDALSTRFNAWTRSTSMGQQEGRRKKDHIRLFGSCHRVSTALLKSFVNSLHCRHLSALSSPSG
jgi:hypothetical protein